MGIGDWAQSQSPFIFFKLFINFSIKLNNYDKNNLYNFLQNYIIN